MQAKPEWQRHQQRLLAELGEITLQEEALAARKALVRRQLQSLDDTAELAAGVDAVNAKEAQAAAKPEAEG